MTGRKGIVGLALLCMLAFSAFGAANASAALHTTAFTCVKGGGELDFKDPHCTEFVGKEKGEYGHVAIAANTSTEIIGSNETTASAISSWILTGTIAGTPIEITCGTVKAMGSIKNDTTVKVGEVVTGAITGSGTLETTACKLLKPESQKENCTVTVNNTPSVSVSEGMGTKFSPATGTTFTEITIANAAGKTCKGVAGTFKVTGTAFAHGHIPKEGTVNYSGATLHFTKAETEKTLLFAGNPAGLEGTLTLRMGPTTEPGNPITATTVA